MNRVVPWLLIGLVIAVTGIMAGVTAQISSIRNPPEGYPSAWQTRLITFESVTREGNQNSVNKWLMSLPARNYRIVDIDFTSDSSNYEIFGGRGVEPKFVAAVQYVIQ